MSTQKTITELMNQSVEEISQSLEASSFFKTISELKLVEGRTQNLILTSLFVSFVKMALIDRDYDDLEEAQIIKRLQRFANIDTLTLFKASNAIKRLLNQNRNETALIYSFSVYLAKKANQKSKDRIFNSFIQITQADNEVSEQEKYLIKNYALIFGMNEMEAFEQILAASLLAQSDDSIEDEKKAEPHLENEAPIIKFEY